MKMDNENKLKILILTYGIKQLCHDIESTILEGCGTFCFESGNFDKIDNLFELAKKLKALNT